MVSSRLSFSKEWILEAIELETLSLGYSFLKKEQKDIILDFILGNDVFAVLPTGFGKSLCYACLPRVFDRLLGTTNSVVIVLTPLTAIMKDQVR